MGRGRHPFTIRELPTLSPVFKIKVKLFFGLHRLVRFIRAAARSSELRLETDIEAARLKLRYQLA